MPAEEDPSLALQEAAAWRIRLADERQVRTPEFETWLAKPGNASAWRRSEHIWSALDAMAAHPKVLAYRSAALRRRRGRGPILLGLTAAAAALAMLLAAMTVTERFGAWRTIGGSGPAPRIVRLDDGSKLTLDAGSSVRLRLAHGGRDVELLSGQARFDVAHDARRPFRVRADDRVVTAVGTSFTVDRGAGVVTVTLLSGRVSVMEDPPIWRRVVGAHAARPTYLGPGQRVAMTASSPISRPQPISLDQATAWEHGRLVFDDEPLAAALERVNRYSDAPIQLADPATGRLRVSGVFNAGDTRAFTEAVSHYYGLRVVRGPGGATLLREDLRK